MVREVYDTLNIAPSSPIHAAWREYESLTQVRNNFGIRQFFMGLNLNEEEVGATIDEFANRKEREMWYDLCGKKRLLTHDFHGLIKINNETIMDCLSSPVGDQTMFVTSHPRPDADAVVSSLFEAVRRNLRCPPGTNALPCVEYLPPEVKHLLGPDISRIFRLSENGNDGLGSMNEIVLVDTHLIDPSHRKMVRAIVDHHIMTRLYPYYVAVSQEVSWSSTIQVYVKMLGSGMDLDEHTARILLDATKLEAEPELWTHMSEIDHLAFERLNSLAGPSFSSCTDLMRLMVTSATDEESFYKDYKEDLYGFAVIKCLVTRDYTEIAVRNNAQHQLLLTIVKQVLYNTDFSSVIFESIQLVFNDVYHDCGFQKCMRKLIQAACEAFHGANQVSSLLNLTTIKGIKTQTPRLLLMPTIKDVVEEHLKFAYSERLGRYVACGFFTESPGRYGDGEYLPVCLRLSYRDAKRLLLSSSNTSFMTLPQFWQVYEEFTNKHYCHAIRSLEDTKHVELLDTLIFDRTSVQHGDQLPSEVAISPACPALIRPEDGYQVTGIPKKILSPDFYGDRSLWRYWSPDSPINVATRGHIFIMNQSCIDLKIRPDESTSNLTFRPVYRDIPDMAFTIETEGMWVKVLIKPRSFSIYEI
ncbi:MAG: hypothetical protein Q9217_006706 [Psora testacea]